MDYRGVGYLWIIVMFLSAVWTLILTAPIHCRGSIGEQVMQSYISTNLKNTKKHEETNSSTYLMAWVFTSVNVHFWVNYYFKALVA